MNTKTKWLALICLLVPTLVLATKKKDPANAALLKAAAVIKKAEKAVKKADTTVKKAKATAKAAKAVAKKAVKTAKKAAKTAKKAAAPAKRAVAPVKKVEDAVKKAAKLPAKKAPTTKAKLSKEPRVLTITATSKKMPKAGTRLAAILNSQVLRVCVRTDIPPFGYFTGRTITGFDIQLAQQISTTLSNFYEKNLHVAWSVINAGGRISSLLQKSCDLVIASFSYTKARAQLISFSNVYLQTDKVVIASKNITRKVPVTAIVRGTTSNVKNLKGIKKYFNNYTEIIYAMEAGIVDYAISDRPIALHMIRSVSRPFKILKTLAQQEKYAIGINKGHKTLLKAVNDALDSLSKTGNLAYLHRQWL